MPLGVLWSNLRVLAIRPKRLIPLLRGPEDRSDVEVRIGEHRIGLDGALEVLHRVLIALFLLVEDAEAEVELRLVADERRVREQLLVLLDRERAHALLLVDVAERHDDVGVARRDIDRLQRVRLGVVELVLRDSQERHPSVVEMLPLFHALLLLALLEQLLGGGGSPRSIARSARPY